MSRISKYRALVSWVVLAALSVTGRAQTNVSASTNLFTHPLSRVEAVEMALRQNSTILKGRADLHASFGVEIQLRSVALPQFTASGAYNAEGDSLIESFPLPAPLFSLVYPASRIKIGTPTSKCNRPFTRRPATFSFSFGEVDAATGFAELPDSSGRYAVGGKSGLRRRPGGVAAKFPSTNLPSSF